MNITTRFLSGAAAMLVATQGVPAVTQETPSSPGPAEPAKPQEVIDLLARPEQIAPGIEYRLPGSQDVLTVKGSGQGEFDQQQRLSTSLELARRAGIKVPTSVTGPEARVVKAIKVTGAASTYGIGDGLYGARTSSGRPAVRGVAALEMDLAHVLRDKGAVPHSMAGVKAEVRFPSGQTVSKDLVDKGGLHNPLTERDWNQRIQNAKVNEHGVADLGKMSHRVIDIVGPVNLYPEVTVTVPLKRPFTLKSQVPPGLALQRLSQWARNQQGD